MNSYQITINGIVQGVGFRPFVFRLAEKYELKGFVTNGNKGVKIVFVADDEKANEFLRQIIAFAPENAKIEDYFIEKFESNFFEKFEILESETNGEKNLLLTPDYGICETCRNEIHEPENKRFGYAFTTCTDCGPRFSICNSMPFDRETTTMLEFVMCETCKNEYQSPSDRRFFAQTNSCPKCGISLAMSGTEKLSQNEIIEQIVANLRAGKIGAIKGIGGYLLICDATNEASIELLRQRKHRPTKPFALMYPNVSAIKKDVFLSKIEEIELKSAASPIVLLKIKNEIGTNIKINKIAPKLSKLGIMLPYTPLFELILSNFQQPTIATSGNISGSPIVFDNEKAENELSEIADFIVSNNREIVVPQDDSVIQFSEKHKQRIVIRRGRGFAPNYIDKILLKNADATHSVLAFGASMKSTFAWQIHQNLFVSQYLGDLESFDTQLNFEKVLKHFEGIFETQPTQLIADKHEGYFSTQLANQFAEKLKIPIQKVQHHQAHFWAVLAENNLLESENDILGIVWDGTGLGDDNEIWGGEFFVKYSDNQVLSRLYFTYFDFILGDKMSREPRISALALAHGIENANEHLQEKFSEAEWSFYQKLLKSSNKKKTSSMGRIFDGVASLLGLADKVSYEGEAAMLLEEVANEFFIKSNYQFSDLYFVNFNGKNVDTQSLISQIIEDILLKKETGFITLKFHFTLVEIIKNVANFLNTSKLVFSGGVFQNALLVDLIIQKLSSEFELFFHKNLSPNDECISFGQLVFSLKNP